MMVKYSHDELTPEDEKRLSDLFERLDINKDGRINVKDLTEALHQLQVPKAMVPGHAKVNCQSDSRLISLITVLLWFIYVFLLL